MAQYKVNYSCGHAGIVNLFGKCTEREQKIAWYEKQGLCPECYAREKEAAREALRNAAKAQAQELKLPELEGTEKQVNWAIVIRAQMLSRYEATRANNAKLILGRIEEARRAYETQNEELIAQLEAMTDDQRAQLEIIEKEQKAILDRYNKILTETSAKWFIENRPQ
jgi:hypothetical protein